MRVPVIYTLFAGQCQALCQVLVCIIPFHLSPLPCEMGMIIFMLQTGTKKLREVRGCIQNRTASNWHS